MKTKTINLYSFDELSDEAKERAINELADINIDHEWWESTYEDAERIGLKITSFDLGNSKKIGGSLTLSGLDCCAKILEEHGPTCDTYTMARKWLVAFNRVKEQIAAFDDIELISEHEEEREELTKDFERELLEEYLSILSKDYDYLTSEEQIIESIKSNEYDFDEQGYLS